MLKLRIAVCLLAALSLGAPAMAGDWYQWRGPEQDGVSREKNLPEKWSPDGDNLVWKNGVGGMSSPIVMNGFVYAFTRVGEVPAGEGATATLDPGPKTQEALTCVDAKTGKIVWQHMENMYVSDDPFHRLGWSNITGDPKTGHVYGLGAQKRAGLLRRQNRRRHLETPDGGRIWHDHHVRRTNPVAGHR